MHTHLIQTVEKQKEKIIRDFSLLETMTPLIKAEGFFPPVSEILGSYRLGHEEMGKWKNIQYFPHPFWALTDPLSTPKANTREPPGVSLSTPRSTPRLHTIVPLAWKYHRKKTVNSLLVSWYFKYRSSSLIPPLLLTSQNLQIAAAGILSRFCSCIQCKTQGGIYLPIARNPWKIFANVFFSLMVNWVFYCKWSHCIWAMECQGSVKCWVMPQDHHK